MISLQTAELAALQGIQIIFNYQQALGINDTQLACELGISEHSIKCYKLNTKNKRYPSESVVKLAKLKLRLWEQGIKISDFD
ncbi:hypothetical protein [Planktothrix sp. FACHB-1365]|uniref:hypothetical protein n=1 Tax=Planktothrix sp. FACHB-1365 TaxID=2692855 RepID=UPI001689851B|nr:hypothetical protein [Planktothrix sp. FACHB-1365]MBD2485883.1 hypothetical protein [Planktothrix sp. FACHB-1365]